jgi:hypothetical protein
MRKAKVVSCVFVVLFSVSGVVSAGDVSVGVGADVLSKYVWRGQNLVDGAVFQPGASVGYKGLTGSIWGNLDMTDKNDNSGNFTEVDYTIDYSGTMPGFDKLSYSVGAIYYDFPNTGLDGTTEVYVGFCLDVPASPGVTIYHDVDEADGTYVSFSAGHSIEKLGTLPVGLDLDVSLGWGNKTYNSFYWGTTGSELNDLVLSAGLPFEVAGITITPKVSLITLLGSDVKEADAYDTSNSVVVFGVGFAKEF